MNPNDHIIELNDENGGQHLYEMLGICEYTDGNYLILLPNTDENPATPEVMLIEGEGENERYLVEHDPYKRADILNAFCLQHQQTIVPCGVQLQHPPEMKIFRPMHSWSGLALYLLRIVIPLLTLLLFIPFIDTLYIHEVSKWMPPSVLQLLVYAGHMMAIGWSFNAKLWQSWRYEISLMLFPAAICMLLFFAQYHFVAALSIVVSLAVGALLIALFRHKLPTLLAKRPYWEQLIKADMAYSKSIGRTFDTQLAVVLRRGIVVGFVTLMIVPTAYTWFKYGLNPIEYRASQALSHEEFENDSGFFENFIEENWLTLTTEEKIDALQEISYLEAERLNIDDVYVHAEDIGDARISYHIRNTRDIFIDLTREVHQDPMECIHTILHECRHVYQNDCINSMNWASPQVQSGIYYEAVREWRYNLENYHSAADGNNYELYYWQAVEKDAREYADSAIGLYESIVLQYVDKNP